MKTNRSNLFSRTPTLTTPPRRAYTTKHVHAQAKARRLRQAGFPHSLAQSQALEASCAVFREAKAVRVAADEDRRRQEDDRWENVPEHGDPR